MTAKILVVEDIFIEGYHLRMMLEKAGYLVCQVATSVTSALKIINTERPSMVLIDIFLKGGQTGFDLAVILQTMQIPFVYVSANSNQLTVDQAKATRPYGYIVKPFREKDVLVTLEIAFYLHQSKQVDKENKSGELIDRATIANAGEQHTFFTDIIGTSPKLAEVLQSIQIVAPFDTSVLILGESGTGKEKIADYIHALSTRKGKPFVKINCAALAPTLIESELFGHERGAFTGANERRIGKFEQANGGTIFLDEISEISLELQSKLLRVLQEKELERLGSNQLRKINVRVISASNQDLERAVRDGSFRIDLYYRLNVFPIYVPPLRERKEDIPRLVYHFMKESSKLAARHVTSVSTEILDKLMAYTWPGNIRELKHFIERAVVLTVGNQLKDIPLPTDWSSPVINTAEPIKTMDANERDNILAALQKANGKVFGPGGAAEILGVSVSTLNARMKKYGLKREKGYHVVNRL